jgi:sarcosine oxidase subunit alpha
VFEPFIRQSAGLGQSAGPKHTDPDRYEHFYAHVDIVVAGGGIAGLQAALEAGRAGAKVLLCEQTAHWGGRAPVDGVTVDGAPAEDWVAATVAELEGDGERPPRLRTMVAGVYDHGYVWPMSACRIMPAGRHAAPPALAHPHGAGDLGHRRHRTPAQLRRKRQAG